MISWEVLLEKPLTGRGTQRTGSQASVYTAPFILNANCLSVGLYAGGETEPRGMGEPKGGTGQSKFSKEVGMALLEHRLDHRLEQRNNKGSQRSSLVD